VWGPANKLHNFYARALLGNGGKSLDTSLIEASIIAAKSSREAGWTLTRRALLERASKKSRGGISSAFPAIAGGHGVLLPSQDFEAPPAWP